MFDYLTRQLLMLVLVMLGVSVLVFVLMNYTPGDAIAVMVLRGGAQVSGEDLERFREEMGLNDPLYVQYLRFLGNALRGDLGKSLRNSRPVVRILAEQLPSTVELAVASMGLAIILGMGLGVVSAARQNSWLDSISMSVALVGWSIPNFWFGLLLILVFGLTLGWFPITGGTRLERLVLPTVSLGLVSAGLVARLVRSAVLEVVRMDYVTTARAKGLSPRVVMARHVLRNALVPVVTMIGIQFGYLLSGAVVIETVFARQGIGRVIVDAILARDMPVVQGGVLLLAAIFVLSNLAVDVSYAFLDPRIRQKS